MLKTKKSAPSTRRIEMNPHLRRAFRCKGQRKTLLKKTDNAEVIGDPSHDDSGESTGYIDRRFDLGTRKLPQVLLKYIRGERAQSERLQVQSSASKSANSGHQLMAQAQSRRISRRHKAGSSTYLGPTGVPKPV